MSSDGDKEYLRKHGIPALFNELTQELFRDRPEQPVPFLIELLKAKREQRLKQGGGGAAAASPAAGSSPSHPSSNNSGS